MKKILTNYGLPRRILFLLSFVVLNSLGINAQQLIFDYDAAGNQTQRQWICINCRPASAPTAMLKTVTAEEKVQVQQKEAELAGIDELVHGWVKASPNPISETLQVNWLNSEGKVLQGIEVYAVNGTCVFTATYSTGEQSAEISFSSQPPAVYILLVRYAGGKKETIKIIKR